MTEQFELGDILAVRDAQARSGYMANTGFYNPGMSGGSPFNPSSSGYNFPTFLINVPNPFDSSFPSAGVGYTAPPVPPAPSIIFADQNNTKLAIRLGDLPAGVKLKLSPAIFCDSVTGAQTTGYAFFPDSSSGYF